MLLIFATPNHLYCLNEYNILMFDARLTMMLELATEGSDKRYNTDRIRIADVFTDSRVRGIRIGLRLKRVDRLRQVGRQADGLFKTGRLF